MADVNNVRMVSVLNAISPSHSVLTHQPQERITIIGRMWLALIGCLFSSASLHGVQVSEVVTDGVYMIVNLGTMIKHTTVDEKMKLNYSASCDTLSCSSLPHRSRRQPAG